MTDKTKSRDSEIRMYVRGRLDRTGTDRIELAALNDRGTQARLDALRQQSIALRQAFTFPPCDLSRVQVGVRSRSPYRALGIPPAAALWLQIVGMVAMLVLLQNTGASIAPPDVMLERSEGRVLLDSRQLSVSRGKRLVMNQEIQTTAGAQATLQLDFANRVALAPETTVVLLDPREGVRQVLGLTKGELWARFSAAGQKFAVVFNRGQFEVSGTTAEFDVVTGDRALAMLPFNLAATAPDQVPLAVLRVFRGSVNARQGYGKGQPVSRDQWMVFYAKAQPVTGEQGSENFKLLRLDTTERFKDNLHWLSTDSYPLRAEISTLELERRLHGLARALLDYRNQYVVRSGRTEIYAFNAELTKTIREARERIAAGTPLPEDRLPPAGPLRMRDEDLLAAAPMLDEIVARWVARAESYATLGSAAKTLLGRSQMLEQELGRRDNELTKAIALKNDLDKLLARVAEYNVEIEKLNADAYHDPDGSKRKALDVLIDEQRKVEKLAGEARAKLDLVKFKLNGFESKVDDAKRARVPLAQALADKQKAVDEISAKQKANPYTAEKLAQARETAEDARARFASARDNASKLTEDVKAAEAAIASLSKEVEKLTMDVEKFDAAVTQAKADHETAKAALEKADAGVLHADKDVEEVQKKIDALPEKDRAKSPLQDDLKKAKSAREKAYTAQTKAKEALGTADVALIDAEATAKKFRADLDRSQGSVTSRKDALLTLKKTLASANEDVAKAKTAATDAEAAQKAQETAKAELEVLAVQWGEAADAMSKAQFTLEDQDLVIKKLEEDAAPLRKELAELLATVEAGDKAAVEIKRLDTEKQKSEAVGQEITKRTAGRDDLQAACDEMKGRPLLVNYEKLKADFNTMHAERAGLEYLRARALQEDGRRAAEQHEALDRYNELARKAELQAVALLDGFCDPYRGSPRSFMLADNDADDLVAKRKLLETLWRLYYSGEPELRADGRAMQCYYVIAEASSNADALRELDQRWSAALAAVLGKERYEAASRLTALDLQSPQRK